MVTVSLSCTKYQPIATVKYAFSKLLFVQKFKDHFILGPQKVIYFKLKSTEYRQASISLNGLS